MALLLYLNVDGWKEGFKKKLEQHREERYASFLISPRGSPEYGVQSPRCGVKIKRKECRFGEVHSPFKSARGVVSSERR